MSTFWNWWVILLTVINIAACLWLILWTQKKRPGEVAEGEKMGHSWDGIVEYNNPMPRWWLGMFYGTLVFSVIYLILYPGLGNYKGVFGWTQVSQYEEEVKAAEAQYGPIFERYAQTDIPTLAKDAEAVTIGKNLFMTYCTGCHGSTAEGARGFPNLTDKDWLWGGTPELIKASIMNGRTGAMPPMGPVLGEQGVDEVAAYVRSLSGVATDAAKAAAGKQRFTAAGCIACHGPEGKGNPAMGAPNLTDNTWLYGGSPKVVRETITKGRTGRMPAHGEFLGESKVHLLAAYVYSLSQE